MVAVGAAGLVAVLLSYLGCPGPAQVRIHGTHSTRAAVGAEFDGSLTFDNTGDSWTPQTTITVKSGLATPASVVVAPLPPRASAHTTLNHKAKARGVEQVHTVELEVRDVMGLFRRVGVTTVPRELMVHPATGWVPLPAARVAAAVGLHAGDTEDQIGTFRTWQSGDEPRRVNWRASARSPRLVVNTPEVDAGRRVAVIVVAASRQDDLESAVSLAASALVSAVRAGLSVRIAAGRAAPETGDTAPLDDALDRCAALGPADVVLVHDIGAGSSLRTDGSEELWVAPTAEAAHSLGRHDTAPWSILRPPGSPT